MKLKYLLAILVLCGFSPLHAAPWVEADDLGLRSDIQLLADAGIITAPVTTFPLMWGSIAEDIENHNLEGLTRLQSEAMANVRHHLRRSMGNLYASRVKAYAASASKRLSSFGNDEYQRSQLELSHEKVSKSFAAKLQVNYRAEPGPTINQVSEDKINFDGSYVAMNVDLDNVNLGQWVVIGGAIEKWWGPGVDTSLIMSTNARPLPALSVTRNESKAFSSKWLNWLGPWSFTAQMAKMESNRVITDALMWSSRASIRPLRGLELGTSWSFQWAGEGQPGSLSNFFDALTGGKECADGALDCDAELNTFQGNHLAGYDIRWSDTLASVPYAIYAQTIGEDGSPNGLVTDKAYLFGIESRFKVFEQRLLMNLEYTDTRVSCGDVNDNSQNCFYEHGLYRSGYRYYRRSIGSTYDNDAQTVVLTALLQMKSGNQWQFKLAQADLNSNDSDTYPNDSSLGNSVSKVAEELTQLDLQYRFNAFGGKLTVGGIVTDSSIATINDNAAYLKYEYRF